MTLEIEIAEQVRAVREKAGRIDRSDAGKLALVGVDRYTWLQGMVSNDARLLAEGKTKRLQACVLDATGHLLSDITLIDIRSAETRAFADAPALSEQDFVLAELPRENLAKIAAIFDRFLITEDVEIHDVSDPVACLSFQGPKAALLPLDKPGFRELFCIVPADHTGSGGTDWHFPADVRSELLALMEANPALFPVEVGPEAQEILRVEAGIPKYGVDMDETTIALEANLGPTHISLTKGCYVGQEIIARIDSRGHTNRALTGLLLEGDSLPAPGDKLFSLPTDETEARETGRITSVIPHSPAAEGQPIALGYVRHEHRTPGNRLRIGDEASNAFATVVDLPFIRKPKA